MHVLRALTDQATSYEYIRNSQFAYQKEGSRFL
jgi:hypothetical protein